MVRRQAGLLALLAGAAVAKIPTPNYEMKPCIPGETGDCHFIPGEPVEWDEDTETYTVNHEDGAYGAPFYDSVDTEWSQKFVDNTVLDLIDGATLRERIVNGEVRIGRPISAAVGRGDLSLPLPGNDPDYTGPEEYLEMLHPGKPSTRKIHLLDQGKEIEFEIDLRKAMRSGGFPMCPNYWDFFDRDNPGPLNLGFDSINQDGELYKFPNKVVGSPLVGDPELHFCRKWQQKYDATCCTTWLDEDIQEEYEELTGSGYLGAHVFVQQFLCLPCHPMISCMIDEASSTLRIPLQFAKKLAEKMEDFDRTGLKVKVGELDDNLGPLRQDEHFIPSQHFARQRGSHGPPAPPFPVPNCQANVDLFPGLTDPLQAASTKLGYWPTDDCPQAAEFETDTGEEDGVPLNLFAPDMEGKCECLGPGKHCACVREFLLHLRPPGINGYDGLDLNIEIVDDDSCGVLFDLMAGAIPDPLLVGAASGVPGTRLSLSVLAAGMALTVLQHLGGAR